KAKRKAKLRLDTEKGSAKEQGGLDVVEPGDPAKSELFRRITAEEESERMPPKSSGRKLTKRQIDLLRRWIEQRAPWEKHCAFLPPTRHPLPKVQRAAWARHPIDSFILERLEREGLEPSPEAAKTTLLRRVTLDLTGLPPTPAEVDAFLADKGPDAYEKVVDR